MKKLFKLAVFAGIVMAVIKVVEAKKAEWQGLTETQVREKLHSRLDDKMPAEKIDEFGDKVVEKMRQRGVLGTEVATADETSAAAE